MRAIGAVFLIERPLFRFQVPPESPAHDQISDIFSFWSRPQRPCLPGLGGAKIGLRVR